MSKEDLIIRKRQNQLEKKDEIRAFVEKFQRNSNAIYCSVIDIDGFIFASELAENIGESVDHNAIVFFNALQFITKNRLNLINFTNEIGKISIYFDYDLDAMPAGVTLLIKSVVPGVCFIVVLPAWLDLTFIEIEFYRVAKKLRKILENKIFMNNSNKK